MSGYEELKIVNGSVIVDSDIVHLLAAINWHIPKAHIGRKHPYARTRSPKGYYRGIKTTWIYMHRLVMGNFDKDFVVDHINGNSLDNRKCNLRVVTSFDNTHKYARRFYRAENKHGGLPEGEFNVALRMLSRGHSAGDVASIVGVSEQVIVDLQNSLQFP